MLYAEIILPIAGPCYTFSVETELADSLKEGCAVSVQFGTGGRKLVGGIVRRLHGETPAYKRLKPVLSLLFPEPIVSDVQMELWEWTADYYMCSLGEVMRAALPAMLKPTGLSAEQFAADGFKARREKVVRLAPEVVSEEALGAACEKLRRRAPKMYAALMGIVARLDGDLSGEVARADLTADAAALAALQKKGIIEVSEREMSAGCENGGRDETAFRLPELSAAQQTALDGLRGAFGKHDVALLFGVPAGGKSEVCCHAIARALAKGRDVMLLLPEISLTTQFVGRVRRVFGEKVVLYHSGLTDRRRAEAYLRLANSSGGSLVVGTRSAVFLPMPRLGLVVVDEEQDASYKQQDPAPRYNARDTAIVLARLNGAKVILSSATPSLETWTNALNKKYGLVELAERYGGSPPPEVIISDTLRSARRGERRSHFNKELLDRIALTLSRGRQVILFQNRRGVAPFIECPDCGWVPRCDHCGIPLSVHRATLRCHYCGASQPLPGVCPSCGGMNLAARGFGTEKIEQELARLFPNARIARLDRDSAGSQRAYSRIISDFENGSTDILIGTQMITKGLDFAGVSLVGILNADNLVNHPDFRASERAYQLIAQVAGRAGRRDERGEVVIQTAAPESRLIARAAVGDYAGIADEMLAERALYDYPPYSRLVRIMLRYVSREGLDAAAAKFGELVRAEFGELLLGPVQPVVERIKGEFALLFLLKVPRVGSVPRSGETGAKTRPMSDVREKLLAAIHTVQSDPAFKKVTITPDVDPQ